ncbi:hypothetical protein PHJA_002739200 [Phtheirospermum japonicum]|uniref:HMA domain-containing protein n=1 Tax=Phtheirospermum japonicum TaxID=374723 RepID=A0A830DIX4_9LAMI|nr:hypothetical protein PHJA_002739200 [Phtheirospermum japonicum]
MASGAGKSAAFMLLILNVFLYLILIAIAAWAVNHGIEKSHKTASVLSLPARIFPIYYPFGNLATGFVVILSLVAGVVGFTTSVTGISSVIQWNAPNLHAAATSSLVSWLLTLLAMGSLRDDLVISAMKPKFDFHLIAFPRFSMGGKTKKDKEKRVVKAEYKITMHCNACEKSVAKVISKIKGVETFITDTTNHRVVVTGMIDPHKVLKKLKKKTGKKVELLVEDQNAKDEETQLRLEDSDQEQAMDSWLVHYYGDGFDDVEFEGGGTELYRGGDGFVGERSGTKAEESPEFIFRSTRPNPVKDSIRSCKASMLILSITSWVVMEFPLLLPSSSLLPSVVL